MFARTAKSGGRSESTSRAETNRRHRHRGHGCRCSRGCRAIWPGGHACAREEAGTADDIRASARRSARTSRIGIREDSLLGCVHHGPRRGVRGRECRVFHGAVRRAGETGYAGVDHAAKAVDVTLPNGSVRTAKHFGDQGCITLPIGKAMLNFTPADVKSTLPDPETQPWPMGDVLLEGPAPDRR